MKRSKFSLSNYKLFSCDMGELIPCGLLEVLPGDTIQHSTSALIRCSPLLAPVMHPVHVNIRHFFVPHRLVWDDWEDFITGGPDGMDDSEFPTKQMNGTNNATGTLPDYMGIPRNEAGNLLVSALPFRAFNLIYNEYYRDQDLQPERALETNSGVDSVTDISMCNVNWEKDYFTSARPWEQKGPSITIPIGGVAPVKTTGTNVNIRSTNAPNVDAAWYHAAANPADLYIANPGAAAGSIRFGTSTGLQADLTGVSSVTVNILREAMALQRYEEARARFGSRYTEYLRYLGVRSSDARLQRPEYLGGGRQTIQFSEVLQTAEGADPVGDLKGHGISAMRSNRYRRFFEEHGYILSLMSVRPKAMYLNGVARTWNRRTKEDFWQKELQHIGQQEVLGQELYFSAANNNVVFGFQDRYDEYRRQQNTIAGEFRNSTLDYWHLGRTFASAPALNSAFVTCNPSERIFAVPSQDVLYVMAHHSIQARRMVARTGSSFIF